MHSQRLAFLFVLTLAGAVALSMAFAPHAMSGDRDKDDDDREAGQHEQDRARIGLQIAPVELNVVGKDRKLVGLGSYLVNAVGGCNDCHTCPSYDPTNNPYKGMPGKVNRANYLAGGVMFGPFTSRNITPDFSGKPAGLTREQFVAALRTGHDSEPPHDILQVMPWPVFRNMSDGDLHAIYEYLSAIPHANPGICNGAGQ